jgi:hypothetical protein
MLSGLIRVFNPNTQSRALSHVNLAHIIANDAAKKQNRLPLASLGISKIASWQ